MSNDYDVKKNVQKFEEDVKAGGSYEYTGDRLSSSLANTRISEAIASAYDFRGKTILDIGCGDGSYTLQFPSLGVKMTYGIDPAATAVEAAHKRAEELGVESVVQFQIGNVYDLSEFLSANNVDCIVFRGVLHHLPDPQRAIQGLHDFNGAIVVLEPNGYNPVLKIIEKVSTYHIEHEERSFSASLLSKWLKSAGYTDLKVDYCNLVPMFCPDLLAKCCKTFEPIVEKLPFLKQIGCGQVVITARR